MIRRRWRNWCSETVSASVATNLGGGSRGDTTALGLARFGAKSSYTVYRFGTSYARALSGDWQVRNPPVRSESPIGL